MKKELFLEEAVLDDMAQSFNVLELPVSKKAFNFISFAAAFVGLVVIFRIFYLGIWQGDFYKNRALINSSQLTVVRTQRGIVFDRFNKPLVQNQPAFRLNLKLAELLKSGSEKEKIIKTLEEILALPNGYINGLLSRVDLERQNSLTLARELSVEDVIKIKNLNLPAVQVDDDFKRQYPEGEQFAHILGYTGLVSSEDLKKNNSLSLNEIIGKSGLEFYYDKELKGTDGETLNYRNSKGEIMDNKLLENPVPGYQLYSTIDAEFQKFFYNRLKEALSYLGSRAGVGIAMNPQTGEILSIFSLPSFDNGKIKTEDLINQKKPLFNRAVGGAYNPGSTIKPLVAFAALKENIISPDKQILSVGYIDIPNPYHPDQPSRFVDWKPHGWVDLYSALARSSNVYFYEIGGGYRDQKGLGIQRLKEYWQKFGLGEKTGIDLPSENIGFLPDDKLKEKSTGDIWRIGDTYNATIGQGDVLVTPIQLINYISAIANGGKINKPFIIQKIVSEDGSVIKETRPEVLKDYSSDIDIIKKVQKGMIDGVEKPYGTAHLLADLPFSIASKTGSAQVESKTKVNAFFVGFTPTDNPQLAILILIEDAREGSMNTVPVAKDVLRWYYDNRLVKSL